MKPALTRHLDLGCGPIARNPYRQDELYGIDIAPCGDTGSACIKQANLALEPIPFERAHFDSVSAFDFIEHMPRLLSTADGQGPRFPFVELMNEVHRVLRPGGRFYALTPAYPDIEAFSDPTHVNIISATTHSYFCGPTPLARMYGCTGSFECNRADWVVHKDALDPRQRLSIRQRLRHFNYRLKGKLIHLVWKLQAV